MRAAKTPKNRGGRPPKRLEWPSYSLSTREELNAFLDHLIQQEYTGDLDPRRAGAINNSIRLKMELNGWIVRPAPVVVQVPPQAVKPTLEELKQLFALLPPEGKVKVAEWIKAMEASEVGAGAG